MYIDSIVIKDFRTFRAVKVDFSHKDRRWNDELPKSKLPNVNLLLGNNGCGKTTLLKAISLAAMGPAVSDSGIFAYRLIRREPSSKKSESRSINEASIASTFRSHVQDDAPVDYVESEITITRRVDIEQMRWTHDHDKPWHPIFSSSSDAFFMVGYGATRRVEKRDQADIASRSQSSFVRAQRIQSLFEESYSLFPLSAWLPRYKNENPGHYKQVVTLMNKLMGPGQFKFSGQLEDDEYVFEKSGLQVPFPALSDGYRAFLGWVGDLLYHICMTCPSGKKLVDNHGLVMVDEIDLHIHPKWQIEVLPRLAKALPNIQFIVTSHSPLVVGSLEWMNILVMKPARGQSSKPVRRREAVHGMDADQILTSDYFGMSSTRVRAKTSRIDSLTRQARSGDLPAAKKLLKELTTGTEVEDDSL
jgi:predicted ATP-binding protein involved in virulence